MRRVQNQIAQFVRAVVPLRVAAGKLIIMRIDQQQIGQDKPRILARDHPFANIMLIIWQKQRVKLTARTVAVINTGNAAVPCNPLTGFQKALRRVGYYAAVRVQHHLQRAADFRRLLSVQRFLNQRNMPTDEMLNCLHSTALCAVKIRMPRITRFAAIDFLQKSAEAERQAD